MTIENLTCFSCGGKGHIERNCPSSGIIADAAEKPMWCGHCDRRTRLVVAGTTATRCRECHPLWHKELPQHARCPGCREIIYRWDDNPCGAHNSPVKQSDTRPGREEIDAIVAREMAADERRAEMARELHDHPRDDGRGAA